MGRCLSSHILAFALVAAVCVFSCLVNIAQAANATTDPSEVRALNAIFQKWRISAPSDQWNISGEPCSGVAIDATSLDDDKFSMLIKCECSYQNASTCHITQLKVFAMDVVGQIPEELWTLTYLFNLNLNQNFLTGSLSPSIGNLSRMQYLGLAANSLSGELPKQLGDLTDLRSLSLLENNFSGSLPSELGNLVKLEQLYISSSGISGEIPSTFANLRNLARVWASDIQLKGRIPDFIGNWSMLNTLKFQGNSFEGPIPLSLSNLTNLSELRISELSKQSSSLEFMQNMKSLNILVLRNNNISDTIPTNLGEFQNLTQLDLSFNNLVGQIPNSLFNLNSLSHLFLGNNNLNGTIPPEKSASLLNIDLSYNNITGSFPSWVTEQNLQLNLVGNNFKVENSESSGMPSGLNCLQRDFPCNRGTGIYYNFSINCGGSQITSSNGIVYERDNETLGPATYFVADTQRWAVSNVGYFSESTENQNQYTISVPDQFTGTVDSDLFQTARLSASSLRYYGLGLENGNYNVSLLFAESKIPNSNTWKSVGRRIFDVYIQGNLVLKDFDIRREAGEVSFKAVEKEFRAQVLENYLEVHFFWAGKGTCCVPDQLTYGPLVSAIRAIPDFTPSVSNKPPTSKKKKTGLTVGIALGLGVLSFVSVFFVYFIIQRRRHHVDGNEELLGIEAIPNTFSYSELKKATNDFDSANKLGEGGFGIVYKGTLSDGRVIAVKQLSTRSRQGNSEFITEIATISAVQHRNLIKLHGCCIEGDERLLVYEYLENGSLNQLLFGKVSSVLNWPMRYRICLGIARGLAYLHEESQLRIIHRDVKASNILLDHQFFPKISDFGLAKLFDEDKTHLSTRLAGTIGYLAPEYAWRGHLTEKADVFSFGIVALEIVSGRPNSDSGLDIDGKEMCLLEWAWNLHKNNNEIDLVDSRLPEFDEIEVKRVVGISLLCTQASPVSRPSMSRIVAMLSGDVEVTSITSMPQYLSCLNFDDVTRLMNTTNGTVMSDHHTSANNSFRGDG